MASAFALAEISLVVSLTSSQLDIAWQAAAGLKKLVELEKVGVVPTRDLSPEELRAREAAYNALGDSNVVVTGGHDFLRLAASH